MSEFSRQLEDNLQTDINKFNNNSEYSEIRELYRGNFDKIVNYIKRSNPRLAIEDISSIDRTLAGKISDNFLLIQEINKAIIQGKLTLSGIA